MPLIADLHIHSHYSRATSSHLTPAYLQRWAAIKGLGLLGTGDCTHPRWLAELRENLDDAEPGLFVLKDSVRAAFDCGPALAGELPKPAETGNATRFVLTGEISTIYKRDGKTRKVHHLVLLPDFKAAAAFCIKLERVGNIASDGRPILGLDSRTLFSMLLEVDERSVLIPAHIWTPWFSVLGAKSGFDSIEECYGDLSACIPAVETGLSSDPPMNWALSSLDSFSIVSNSDAHSPEKLGREATVFDMELSYDGLRSALFAHKTSGTAPQSGATTQGAILSTVEFFPEEGKYHFDGHRKCGVCMGPGVEPQHITPNGETICPVCGKPLTRGVMGRVLELADRPLGGLASGGAAGSAENSNRRPFCPLIPLGEIVGELLGTSPASKKAAAAYSGLIEKAGSELSLLMEMDTAAIGQLTVQGLSGECLAEAIGRMRRGEVSISPGYDGEYGVVRVFAPGADIASGGGNLFETLEGAVAKPAAKSRKTGAKQVKAATPPKPAPQSAAAPAPAVEFNPAQTAIINADAERALVIAGPGTGKTAVLAARIAHVVKHGADTVLALTFTVKAAAELRERVNTALKDSGCGAVYAATFHSFCCALLREEADAAKLSANFGIMGGAEREQLLKDLCAPAGGKSKTAFAALGRYIEERKRFILLPGERQQKVAPEIIAPLGALFPVPEPQAEMEELYGEYRRRLHAAAMLDYEDLIAVTVRLFHAKKDILEKYRSRFRYVFVDEYQDINLGQYVLLRQLGGGENLASLWVIGDPNQAIYGFRGSDKRFIDRFTLDFPDARRFEMTKSFRCAAPIVAAAGRIAGNALQGTDRPVDLYRCEYPSGESEAEGIARAISALIGGASFFAKDSSDSERGSGGTRYADTAAAGDCAVLVRAAALAAPVVNALNNHGIPFVLTGEQPWWEDEPFKPFLARTRAAAEPETEFFREKDNPALKRLFELAVFFGGLPPLLDALAVSESGGLPEARHEGVNILTIHASKGLEFDHVFVIGLEEGMLPFTLFGGEGGQEQIEEERRLLYVAMTRARVGLHLSWAKARTFKGRKIAGSPSRFLGELETIVPLAHNTIVVKRDKQLQLF